MKIVNKISSLIFMLFTLSYFNAQELQDYKNKIIESNFHKAFLDKSDMYNISKLRKYVQEKKKTINVLLLEKKRIEDGTNLIEKDTVYIHQAVQYFKNLIAKNSVREIKLDSISPNFRRLLSADPYRDFYYNTVDENTKKINLDELKIKIEEMNNRLSNTRSYLILCSNIQYAESDISLCTYQIDIAVDSDYENKITERWVSYISLLSIAAFIIGLVLVFVFRPSNLKDLLNNTTLQFIALFVIVIAVIIFGLLKILGGSELAAILSAISGYILGKGTQEDTIKKIYGKLVATDANENKGNN